MANERGRAAGTDPDPGVEGRSGRQAALASGAVVITVLLWASSFTVIRWSSDELQAGPLALMRVGIAALILTPFALRGRGSAPLIPNAGRVALVLYGTLWFAGYFLALNTAEQHVDAATAALLVNLSPLLIAIGAGLFLRERITRWLMIGTGVSLVGVGVMALGAGAGHGGADMYGVLSGLAAATFLATSVLFQKHLLRANNMVHITWLGCTIGLILLLPFTGLLIQQLRTASAGSIAGAIYLGVFPTALGFSTWAYALRRFPASRLGSLGYLVTITSVLMSWALLSEVPSDLVLAGGVICFAGVITGRRTSGDSHLASTAETPGLKETDRTSAI